MGKHNESVNRSGTCLTPGCGKSRLLARLTRAAPVVAPHPFSTHEPQPGMMDWEDVRVQLVDLPPITADFLEPYVSGMTRAADGAALFVDLMVAEPRMPLQSLDLATMSLQYFQELAQQQATADAVPTDPAVLRPLLEKLPGRPPYLVRGQPAAAYTLQVRQDCEGPARSAPGLQPGTLIYCVAPGRKGAWITLVGLPAERRFGGTHLEWSKPSALRPSGSASLPSCWACWRSTRASSSSVGSSRSTQVALSGILSAFASIRLPSQSGP